LDLALLIDAEHDRGLGRVQVQPDDVVDLLDEQRVVTQLETVSPVGLELNAPHVVLDGGGGHERRECRRPRLRPGR